MAMSAAIVSVMSSICGYFSDITHKYRQFVGFLSCSMQGWYDIYQFSIAHRTISNPSETGFLLVYLMCVTFPTLEANCDLEMNGYMYFEPWDIHSILIILHRAEKDSPREDGRPLLDFRPSLVLKAGRAVNWTPCVSGNIVAAAAIVTVKYIKMCEW